MVCRNTTTDSINFKEEVIKVYKHLGGLNNFKKWAQSHELEFYSLFSEMTTIDVDLKTNSQEF